MDYRQDLDDAFAFVNQLFAATRRKGTSIPYISHLMGVASLVMEAGGGRDEVIAGLLHDVLEDCSSDYVGGAPALRAEVVRRYGARVLEIVEGCTDADVVPKPPWRQRKEEYIRHLRSASPAVRLVSCCDKLHNARAIVKDLRDIGSDLWARFNGGREGTLWYYRMLAATFMAEPVAPHAKELEAAVCEMERLAQ